MKVRSRSGKSGKTGTKTKDAIAPVDESPVSASQSLWAKTFDKEVELTPEEALMAAHWIRQFTGIALGIAFGVLKFTGAPAILSYLAIAVVGPPALLSFANELDTEEISKTSPIQTEGMMPSVALFLLSWILSYTVGLPPSS